MLLMDGQGRTAFRSRHAEVIYMSTKDESSDDFAEFLITADWHHACRFIHAGKVLSDPEY